MTSESRPQTDDFAHTTDPNMSKWERAVALWQTIIEGLVTGTGMDEIAAARLVQDFEASREARADDGLRRALTDEDRRRIAEMQAMARAARPGDIAALWSSEDDYRWLLGKVADVLATPPAPLDVDRLAAAIFDLGYYPPRSAAYDHIPAPLWEQSASREMAERLAARLVSPDEGTGK